MNPYVKNLNRIEIVVTMACTGRCKHCSEGDHASCGESIDGGVAAQAVDAICSRYPVRSLMTFGGEPLLYPETVCRIHEAARRNRIPERSLITNGYFSRQPGRIREVAHMLAEGGVNGILLSVDAFHQETIPLEPVMEFAACAADEGLPIRIQPAWLVSAEDGNPYNRKTREILERFLPLSVPVSCGNIIFPEGNAKKYLSKYFDGREQPVNPYEEDPKDIRTVSFSPNGDVLDGNVYRNGILDILDAYSAGG